MSIGFLFWLLMILWLIFGFYWNRTEISGNYGILGGSLLLFVLLFLLGWRVFGFICPRVTEVSPMVWDLLVWLFAWMLADDCKDWESSP